MSTFFTIAELLSFLAFPCNAKLSFCLQLYYSRPRRTTSFKIMSFFDLFLSPSHVSFCVSQIFWPFLTFRLRLCEIICAYQMSNNFNFYEIKILLNKSPLKNVNVTTSYLLNVYSFVSCSLALRSKA